MLQRVAIDTDPGVDDALALLLAFGWPGVRVELVTSVAGNVGVDLATTNLCRLLTLIAPPRLPVVARGASKPLKRALVTATYVHGEDGLGGLTERRTRDGSPRYPADPRIRVRHNAVRQLLRLVETRGADLTLIALGPLTNVASALRAAPATMRRLGRLVIMGGAIGVPGNVTPGAEFNFFVDPDAADAVLGSGLPMTLIPLDVTRRVRLEASFLTARLAGHRTPGARAVRQMTRRLVKAGGVVLHDPLAVAAALEPSLVQTAPLAVRVETRGEVALGMSVADRRAGSAGPAARPPVDVALGVDADAVLERFAEHALGPLAPGPRRAPRRVVVVGSANTDLSVVAPRLPRRGETVIGAPLATAFGGKGANQAVAARRAGAEVSFLAKLGRDAAGSAYHRHLQREGLELSGVGWDEERASGTALIVVDERGRNQIAVAPGANGAFSPADLRELPRLLGGARVLVAQLEIPLATVEAALRLARSARCVTVLNPAPARALPRRIARLVDVLVPNEGELALLAGERVSGLRDVHRAAGELRARGYAAVVVTLGQRGVVWVDGEGRHRLPGVRVAVKDTTGAGDTFVGNLAAALAEGRPLAEAVARANRAAALSVTRSGAQAGMPRARELRDRSD